MKSKQSVGYLLLILGALILAGCATPVVEPAAAVEDAPAATKPAAEISQLANPAAVSCQEQGYSYQIRTVEDGGQAGVCLFPDGSECDGWDFYNDDCAPGDSATLEVVEETVLVEPTSTPIVPAEMSVAGWLGHVISDQDDDLLVLSPEGAGKLGLSGATPEVEAEIVALRDKEEPGKQAHFWGILTCDAAEDGGCHLLVTWLRAGATFTEPEPIETWEGTLVANSPGMQFDDYFLLAGRFPVGFVIHSLDPELGAQLQALCDTGTPFRVWGQLRTGVPDAFGSQIQVTHIEVE